MIDLVKDYEVDFLKQPMPYRAWNVNWKEMEYGVFDIEPSEHYKFMRPTGFEDIYQSPIFEGDILMQKIPDSVEEKGFFNWFGVVKMVYGCWVCLEVNFDYSNTPLENMTKLYEDADKLAVCGNVLEGIQWTNIEFEQVEVQS